MPDFPTLYDKAQRSERTDKYIVLSALYHLDAHKTPTTASKVLELVRLHLRNKAPKNVPDALRKCGSYAQPVEKGPPLLWKLSESGVQFLRDVSGLELRERVSGEQFGSDIGIVCALEYPELAAVIASLGGPSKWEDSGDARFAHVYRQSRLQTKTGKTLQVIATTSTSMGLTAAAIATTQLIFQFRPRIVVMPGIAAGTRSGNKQFGDILIADPSVDYNSGKVAAEGGIREFLPDPYPLGLHPRIRSLLRRYGGNDEVFSRIRDRWSGELPTAANRMHLGPLGAADQVIDDPTRVLEIQHNWRKLIGVEMETYGVYRACHESPDPKPRFVSFKAVCDFAADKNDSWQEYAAFMSAEFAIEFFRSEWDNLWPSI